MVVVVLLIAILISLFLPNLNSIRSKAEGVICTGRLKNLWYCFSTSLQDGQSWPQVPKDIIVGSPQEESWWLTSTSNTMGLTERDWQCPTIARSSKKMTNSSGNPCLISYLPTLFDSNPRTPMKWPSMPWFTEIGNAHGNGNLIIRTDGSVSGSSEGSH